MLSIKTAYDSGYQFDMSELLSFNNTYAIFKCMCGNTFEKRKYKPYTYATKTIVCPSCRHKSRIKPFQAERQILRRVRYDAKTRGFMFDICIESFSKIIHMACHYCGSVDMNSSRVVLNTIDGTSLETQYKYNGIDRIDNSIGYIISNCVPCCFVCNRAKREMSYNSFIEWIDMMIIYRSGMR